MPIEIPSGLTPELVPLSWLIGEWEGRGRLGAGEGEDPHFIQRMVFVDAGFPYLQYTAESWLADEDGNRIRPLATEMGYWQIDRPLQDADGGPGLAPPDIVPTYTSAEAVESLRNSQDGFDITATIVHPGSIAELYYGQIKGPQIHLSTDAVLRGAHARDYKAATRIFGLVNSDLFWRWDVAAAGAPLAPHASAILRRLSGPRSAQAPSE
ncbi:FABP family protein [Sinomonas sp. ASV486]|uniref:Peroxynitrite isomerase n=1 Tax=Sinomonas puerhi TaxID=3238584 RepID=A0AB39L083_9MICC|nr:FABP family protein [Sinomonas sp. ASV486]MDQ4488716.1 FABP family protein [Sinomonas sp. ASV486]